MAVRNKPVRNRSGKFVRLSPTQGGYKNQFSQFNSTNPKDTKKIISKNDNIGGMKDPNTGKRMGHNSTSMGATGSLSRRQKYYDVRVGLGLAGG